MLQWEEKCVCNHLFEIVMHVPGKGRAHGSLSVTGIASSCVYSLKQKKTKVNFLEAVCV